MPLKKCSSHSFFFKTSYSLEFILRFYLLMRCFPSISHLKYASLSHFPAKKLEHLLPLALCVRWKGKDCQAVLNQVAPFSIPEWDCSCYPCHIFSASEFYSTTSTQGPWSSCWSSHLHTMAWCSGAFGMESSFHLVRVTWRHIGGTCAYLMAFILFWWSSAVSWNVFWVKSYPVRFWNLHRSTLTLGYSTYQKLYSVVWVLQGNSISTTKYNILTFFPKGLFEQVLTVKFLQGNLHIGMLFLFQLFG